MLQAPAFGSLAVQPKWLIRVVLKCCLLIYHVHVLKLSPQLIILLSDMQIKTWLAPTLEELFTEMTKLPRHDTSLALNLLMWTSVRQPIPKQMSSQSKYAHFSCSGLDNGSYSSEIDLAYFPWLLGNSLQTILKFTIPGKNLIALGALPWGVLCLSLC